MKKKLALIGATLATPFFAFAQIQADNAGTLGQSVIQFINSTLVPLLFAASFIVFIYGVFEYFILGAKNEEKRADAAKIMLYGIIGFFVMVSVWGLVNLLQGTFRFNGNTEILPNNLQTTH